MKDVPGFDPRMMEFEGESRCVYRAGSGPAVIVMSEIPGITPAVAAMMMLQANRMSCAGRVTGGI